MVVASPSDVSEVEGGRFATKIECHDARSEGLSRLKLGGIDFLCRMKCEISPLEVQNRQGGFFFLFFSDFWERRMWRGVFFIRLFLREGGLIVNGFLHAKFEFDSSIKILCSSVLNITSYIGRRP